MRKSETTGITDLRWTSPAKLSLLPATSLGPWSPTAS